MALTLAVGLAACSDPAEPGLADDDPTDAGIDAGAPDAEPGAPIAELPASVDLGAGDCGGIATGAFALANPGGSPLSFAFTVPDARFSIDPATGTVAAGASIMVHLSAAVPDEIAAGQALASSFRVATNTGDGEPISVPFTFQSRGATIAIEPPVVGIGQARVGFPSARTFTVRNLGNASAQVVIGQPGGEFRRSFGPAGVVVLAPGEAATGEITYTPVDLGADTREAIVTVNAAHCGARPPALALAGEGVPGDGVMVQGGPLNFGPVACGSGGGANVLPIRLVNPSSIPVPFSADFLPDPELDHHAFFVSQGLGTVPPNSTLELRVHRRPISFPSGPRAYDAVLRITTTLGAASVTDVPVRQVLRTAQLAVSGPHDFGLIPVGQTQVLRMEITNTGNAVASLQATATPRFAAMLPLPLLPGETRVGWVSYTPAITAPVTGTVFLSALGACQAPLELQYDAGHGPYAEVAPATVTAACPAPAALSTQLSVINRGTVPLEISCREARIASGLALQLSPQLLQIPPHTAGAFTVNLAAGPRTPGSVTASIECTTNEPVLRTRVTTLTRTFVEPAPGACGD